MTVEEAASFFADEAPIARSLQTLLDVGLGYLRLGQPAPELSGGEAQRIKLASELQRNTRGHGLYILDEPTTSLHPADIDLLIAQLQRLVDSHNSVIIVEHQLEAIANADWMIDLGPGGGDAGGKVVAQGPPLALARDRVTTQSSRTVRYLASYLGAS
jgi:excinuclease ABC subunit A